MIHISLSPNLEMDDVKLSLKWLTSIFGWKNIHYQAELNKKLSLMFPQAKEILLFNSGRSALMIGLKALNLPIKSKVLLQSFTCSAVPNSIIWNQLTPIYLDIRSTDYNLDTEKLPQKSKARVLIVQHTFGQPAELKKIVEYCQKNNIYLIEDCAHSLGANYKGKSVGSFGDMAIISFGRDKVISSVFGGALIVNNNNLAEPVKNLYKGLKYPSNWWTSQQLLHLPITFLAKKTYSIYLGKLILNLSQKTKLISKAIYPKEYLHQVPSIFPLRLPDPLAGLASHQLTKLERFNSQRRKIAAYYDKNLRHPSISKPKFDPDGIYLRYTIQLEQPEKLKSYLKKSGIFIENKHWYTQPITPSKNPKSVYYLTGQCPVTEEICKRCLNLPTYPLITIDEVECITNLINEWLP